MTARRMLSNTRHSVRFIFADIIVFIWRRLPGHTCFAVSVCICLYVCRMAGVSILRVCLYCDDARLTRQYADVISLKMTC